MNLLSRRLLTQHVAGVPLDDPAAVVDLLGAVQSQDYVGAKWSIGQRVRDASNAALDDAFNAGKILRTHVLRPTWHFVTPKDIRWMQQLTAPHVHALNAYYYRKLELGAAVFRRSEKLLTQALQGGVQLTRREVGALLSRHGIRAAGPRLAYIMMRAELDALVCSGALRGKEHTYVLLDERVPNAASLPRDAALAELARRFFTGHAPATLKHFAWWSGLSLRDAGAGLEMAQEQLTGERINGQLFWSGSHIRWIGRASARAYLLPEYDESLTGSKDLAVADLAPRRAKQPRADMWYRPVIVAGKRAGTWRRTNARGTLRIEASLFASLTLVQQRAVAAAAARYGKFLGIPAEVRWSIAR